MKVLGFFLSWAWFRCSIVFGPCKCKCVVGNKKKQPNVKPKKKKKKSN